MPDPLRARLEALSEWTRTLPDVDPDTALDELVEVMGTEDQGTEVLRRMGDQSQSPDGIPAARPESPPSG